jgi:hypothetical protein
MKSYSLVRLRNQKGNEIQAIQIYSNSGYLAKSFCEKKTPSLIKYKI